MATHNHGYTTTIPITAEGWHARATRTSSAEFEPIQSALLLTVLMSTMVEPEGFTMALFRPNLAVDASGHLLSLESGDFAAFEAQVRAIDQNGEYTGEYRGSDWRVKHKMTCHPFDKIFIPGKEETFVDGSIRSSLPRFNKLFSSIGHSVYGWEKVDGELELEEETEGRTTLPKELQVLIEWAREAREDYVHGEKDAVLIGKVKALIK